MFTIFPFVGEQQHLSLGLNPTGPLIQIGFWPFSVFVCLAHLSEMKQKAIGVFNVPLIENRFILDC